MGVKAICQLYALDRRSSQETWQIEDERLFNTAPVVANEEGLRADGGWKSPDL